MADGWEAADRTPVSRHAVSPMLGGTTEGQGTSHDGSDADGEGLALSSCAWYRRLTTAKKYPVDRPHIKIPVRASTAPTRRHASGNVRSPYPVVVRDLQRTIGDEARAQVLEAEGRLPDRVIACVGGGSNAIGMFTAFVDDPDVELIGVEAAGEGLDSGRHGAPLTVGAKGILHGAYSAVLQDDDGQVVEAHSVSAGLDYPGSGPEHAWLRDSGRVRYVAVEDGAALEAFRRTARLEGIIPALEPSHALAQVIKIAPKKPKDHLMVVNVCVRGDKDIFTVADHLGGM